jgi:hypothetical protein
MVRLLLLSSACRVLLQISYSGNNYVGLPVPTSLRFLGLYFAGFSAEAQLGITYGAYELV